MDKSEVKEYEDHKNPWTNDNLPWKAWGSWFSWGSPVGLGLGWALFIIPTGLFIVMLHAAGLIG